MTKSGLWIDLNTGWLACSPDGLVWDGNEQLVGILEIKCPYSAREMTISEACQKISSFSCLSTEGGIKLAHSHNYYYQVQGQLAITGAQWCDFYVYTPIESHIERIVPDLDFWHSVKEKLSNFYDSYCIPLLRKKPIQSTEHYLAESARDSEC